MLAVKNQLGSQVSQLHMESSYKHSENYRERLTPFQLTLQHHNSPGHFLLAPVSRHAQDGEVGDPDPRLQRARRPGQPQGETQGEVQDQEEQRQRPAAPQAEGSQHSVQVSLLSMLSTQKCIVKERIDNVSLCHDIICKLNSWNIKL